MPGGPKPRKRVPLPNQTNYAGKIAAGTFGKKGLYGALTDLGHSVDPRSLKGALSLGAMFIPGKTIGGFGGRAYEEAPPILAEGMRNRVNNSGTMPRIDHFPYQARHAAEMGHLADSARDWTNFSDLERLVGRENIDRSTLQHGNNLIQDKAVPKYPSFDYEQGYPRELSKAEMVQRMFGPNRPNSSNHTLMMQLLTDMGYKHRHNFRN